MRLDVETARYLAETSLQHLGYDPAEATTIAAYLMDSELRGLGFAGLARILSIADRLGPGGRIKTPIRTIKETPVSARIDGADQLGYLVAEHATRIAIDKALTSGIAVVGASGTWYTGMLSYYAEMAVARGLVLFSASNASPWVAPHGGTEGRLGTNPICFAFPSAREPVIWDIGTSAIIHAEVVLAGRLGQDLPQGVAFDAAGEPTCDPAAALGGALAAWGGHRGGGLGLVVQLLGVLAGSPGQPRELTEFGFLTIAMRPDLLTDTPAFLEEVATYGDAVRGTRPMLGGTPVRMPFDRSRADRARRIASGVVEVPDAIVTALRGFAQG